MLFRDVNFMVVIVHFVSFTQISGVESLADIAADFPGIFRLATPPCLCLPAGFVVSVCAGGHWFRR
jgi:hypothetical protein